MSSYIEVVAPAQNVIEVIGQGEYHIYVEQPNVSTIEVSGLFPSVFVNPILDLGIIY